MAPPDLTPSQPQPDRPRPRPGVAVRVLICLLGFAGLGYAFAHLREPQGMAGIVHAALLGAVAHVLGALPATRR